MGLVYNGTSEFGLLVLIELGVWSVAREFLTFLETGDEM